MIPTRLKIFLLISGVFSTVTTGLGIYAYWRLNQENIGLNQQVSGLQSNLVSVNAGLEEEKNTNSELTQTLQIEQEKNKIAEARVAELSGTVDTFQKLSQLDAELLEKYSKVFFLSENYIPSLLVKIQEQYTTDKSKEFLIYANVTPFLQVMLTVAANEGADMKIVSAYRSFGEQTSLKSSYKFFYGSGANQFSADQGYSEHQLGTTVDFTTPELKGLSLDFQNSAGYKWLTDNAYKYGFALSYPKNNSYYQFEPLHWRFVGRSLATRLHDGGQYFYDLDQREIDQYLISIFD